MLPSEQDHDSNAHQSQEIPVVCVLFQTGTAQIGNPNDILFTAMCVVGSLENPRHIVCDNRIVDKSANQKCAVALFAKVGGWDALLFILLAFFFFLRSSTPTWIPTFWDHPIDRGRIERTNRAFV